MSPQKSKKRPAKAPSTATSSTPSILNLPISSSAASLPSTSAPVQLCPSPTPAKWMTPSSPSYSPWFTPPLVTPSALTRKLPSPHPARLSGPICISTPLTRASTIIKSTSSPLNTLAPTLSPRFTFRAPNFPISSPRPAPNSSNRTPKWSMALSASFTKTTSASSLGPNRTTPASSSLCTCPQVPQATKKPSQLFAISSAWPFNKKVVSTLPTSAPPPGNKLRPLIRSSRNSSLSKRNTTRASSSSPTGIAPTKACFLDRASAPQFMLSHRYQSF